MSKKIAFLFPGQGAQYPGMGQDFFRRFSEAKAVFEEADAFLQTSFSDLIFNGSTAELAQTKNSQLAIFITSVAILRAFQAKNPQYTPSICAGLSLGEYTALVAAEKLSFIDGLALVQARGSLMEEACRLYKGTMRVVLGLEPQEVQTALASIPQAWIANLNCPGQVVIACAVESLELATIALKEAKATRILPLEVSGAFHTPLMQSAQDQLDPMIGKTAIQDSSMQIVMNVPGGIVESAEAIRSYLISQVTHPVYWQKGIETMRAHGCDHFFELGPGQTLAGMNKRLGVPTISIRKVEDLLEVGYATIV